VKPRNVKNIGTTSQKIRYTETNLSWELSEGILRLAKKVRKTATDKRSESEKIAKSPPNVVTSMLCRQSKLRPLRFGSTIKKKNESRTGSESSLPKGHSDLLLTNWEKKTLPQKARKSATGRIPAQNNRDSVLGRFPWKAANIEKATRKRTWEPTQNRL
jgi:hypothetical protein